VILVKYANLTALLQNDGEAKRYFDTLPDYVRDQLSSRPDGINSFASLRDYAENLTRGDD